MLRIDSPGGSATASDAIWRELMITKNERADRPIVASMSDLAASGGYYIAMPAQVIVAQPSTLTGSIGIFGGKFVTGGVYEKLGARIESTSIGKHAEINSPVRPYNPDEAEEARRAAPGLLRPVRGEGRRRRGTARRRRSTRWRRAASGPGARRRSTGWWTRSAGSTSAIALAKERAKIPADSDVELVVYPPRKSFYEILSDQLNGANQSIDVGPVAGGEPAKGELEVLRAMRGPLAMFRRGEPLALMPFTFLR